MLSLQLELCLIIHSYQLQHLTTLVIFQRQVVVRHCAADKQRKVNM